MIALGLSRVLVDKKVVPLKFEIGHFHAKRKERNSHLIVQIPKEKIVNDF